MLENCYLSASIFRIATQPLQPPVKLESQTNQESRHGHKKGTKTKIVTVKLSGNQVPLITLGYCCRRGTSRPNPGSSPS